MPARRAPSGRTRVPAPRRDFAPRWGSPRHRGRTVRVDKKKRFEWLVETVKRELNTPPERFQVRLVQLYYDDDLESYQPVKEEDITDQVAV